MEESCKEHFRNTDDEVQLPNFLSDISNETQHNYQLNLIPKIQGKKQYE